MASAFPPDSVERKILAFLERQQPQGATTQSIESALRTEFEQKLILEGINVLLCKFQIQFVGTVGESQLVKLMDPREREILRLLDQEEQLVYTHIKVADNHGIWLKDIIKNTNLHRQVVTKIVKNLEKKDIIKAVTSVKTPSKKMYMLSHLKPSVEITGGAWFTDHELDTEFVNTLSRACMKFVYDKTRPRPGTLHSPGYALFPTSEDIRLFISNSGLTGVELTIQDIEELLAMLVYDNQLERRQQGSKWVYVAAKKAGDVQPAADGAPEVLKLDAWTEMPCGKCPVFDRCSATGLITPANCVYLQDWLAQ